MAKLNLPWENPPKPRGKKGQGRKLGYSQGFGTNTDLGRVAEAAFVVISGGKKEHGDEKDQKSPLDVVAGSQGFEVKGQSVEGTEYKSTPKPHEIASKESESRRRKLEGTTAIVVLDPKTKVAHAYVRPGFRTGRLSQRTGWNFAGRAVFENENWRLQKRDPITGRWI